MTAQQQEIHDSQLIESVREKYNAARVPFGDAFEAAMKLALSRKRVSPVLADLIVIVGKLLEKELRKVLRKRKPTTRAGRFFRMLIGAS